MLVLPHLAVDRRLFQGPHVPSIVPGLPPRGNKILYYEEESKELNQLRRLSLIDFEFLSVHMKFITFILSKNNIE